MAATTAAFVSHTVSTAAMGIGQFWDQSSTAFASMSLSAFEVKRVPAVITLTTTPKLIAATASVTIAFERHSSPLAISPQVSSKSLSGSISS